MIIDSNYLQNIYQMTSNMALKFSDMQVNTDKQSQNNDTGVEDTVQWIKCL